MDRIVVNRPGSLSATFYDAAGDLVGDGETVTLDLDGVRSGVVFDGEPASLVTPGSGSWRVTLAGTELTDPDLLTGTWNVGGLSYPAVFEAVGADYTSAAVVRRDVPTASPQIVSDALTEVAERIETATGWIWVPRFMQLTVTTDAHGRVNLPKRPVRLLVSATDRDGDTLDVTSWRADRNGIIHTGHGNTQLTLTVEVGEDAPPADLEQAAARAAADIARARTVQDRRHRAELGEAGQAFPYFSTSLKHGRPFGIDGVDAVVMSHRMPYAA